MEPRAEAKTERPTDTREALLAAASRVFAQKGYAGATVKELAEAAGVNVSLVSYYFNGKEGLYRTVLEKFGQDRLAAAERVLKNPESVEDFRVRMKLFIEEFLTCQLEQKDQTCIIHREMDNTMSIAKDIFCNVFVKIFERFLHFIESAQKSGILREDLNAHATASLFFGSLVHLSRVDQIHKEVFNKTLDDSVYREQIVENALRNFLHGVVR